MKEKNTNKRKLPVFITCLTLLGVMLCGCANSTKESVLENQNDEIIEISIENVTLAGKFPDISQIESLANEITVPAIGCRIKIVDCPIAEHEALTKKIQAGIEHVDLIETGLTTSLSELASSGVIRPLETFLHDHGKELEQKVEKLLPATTVDGHVYAVPANLYCGRAEGIGYNADIADKFQINVPSEVNLDVLTSTGRKLKAADSGIYLTVQGNGSLTAFDSFYDIESFGGDFDYGVIMNPVENTRIINAYATEEYRDYCRIIKKWHDEGYIPEDSMTNGLNGQDYFNHGKSFFQFSSVSPGTEMMTAHKSLGFEEKYVPITKNRLTTRLVQEFAWGITNSCEYPEKAMELLNLIYTNADLTNVLQYGRKDIDYTLTKDNKVIPAQNDSPGALYSSYFTRYGDTVMKLQYESDSMITMDDIIAYALESEPGKTFGYVFNSDTVSFQVQAVQNVVNEYRPVLETGMSDDPDMLLDEFLAALDEAGIHEIIAENQRQLDVWLKEH